MSPYAYKKGRAFDLVVRVCSNSVYPNSVENSYKIITDLGTPIGLNGETKILVILGTDGKVWTAYPVK